jgi:hypothetical protein
MDVTRYSSTLVAFQVLIGLLRLQFTIFHLAGEVYLLMSPTTLHFNDYDNGVEYRLYFAHNRAGWNQRTVLCR